MCARYAAGAAFGCLAVLVLTTRPADAQGTERVVSFDVAVTVSENGSAAITETIDYDLGSVPRHGIYRSIPTGFDYTGARPDGFTTSHITRLTPLHDLHVTASRGSGDVSVEQDDRVSTIRIGDPNTTLTGRVTYTVSYVLDGVMTSFEDHDEFDMNVTGLDWNVPIEATTARVTMPGRITRVQCFGGPLNSKLPCESATATAATATYSMHGLNIGEGLTAVLAVPKGVVTHPEDTMVLREDWSLERAFSVSPGRSVPAGLALLGGMAGIGALVWRRGRDQQYVGTAVDQAFGNESDVERRVPLGHGEPLVVEFVPPDGVRPGHMGTLWDEEANHLDVSAMIIDLAVRGWLRIDELESSGFTRRWGHGQSDYRFVQLREFTDPREAIELLPAERVTLEALFRDGREAQLSELRQHFSERMEHIQNELYRDAVSAGWFGERPDRVRASWVGRGVLIIVAGGVLTYFAIRYTTYGLLASVVPLCGLLIAALSSRFPRRTAKGTAVLRRVQGFREIFEAGEGERQRWAERKHLFAEYLPYAMVFGCTERWAATFAALGMSPQEMGLGVWFTSPYGYGPLDFGSSMENFGMATVGSLSAAAPSSAGGFASGSSGFGGGFSGGGFGGGGGGSW